MFEVQFRKLKGDLNINVHNLPSDEDIKNKIIEGIFDVDYFKDIERQITITPTITLTTCARNGARFEKTN